MDEIAAIAGVNKTSLHYYFRSKEKLFDIIFKSVLLEIITFRNVEKIIDEIATELYVFQQKIDRESISFIENLSTVINSFENAFDRLKTLISEYTFGNEAEEIHFFKETKPQLFCKLIYYRKTYNIESIRPNGSDHAQINYIEREL